MIGAFLPFLLLSIPCPAQEDLPPGDDPAAVVRRAVDKRLAENANHHPLRFVLRRKDERRDVIRDVIETPQGDVAMLVAVNGTPLNADGRQAEFARLDNLAAHPELQEHRRKREEEDTARVAKLLRLLPDALIYTYESTEPCGGTRAPEAAVPGTPAPAARSAGEPASACYRMSFTPNPHFDPPDLEANILKGMAGEIWIDKSQERLVRLRAHLVSDVQFGWGFIGRLNKGGTVYLEQADIGGNEWELTRMDLNLTGKALLVKSIDVKLSEEESRFAPVPPGTDYRRAIEMLKSSEQANLHR